MSQKITLVGGGLAGSLMSIYLAKKGYDVHLYERRGDMRLGKYQGGRSINLALSTRGINALSKVGLANDILNISIPMKGRMMHSVAGDLAYQAYGREDQMIYSISRGQLNIKLLQLADRYPNIHMYFDHKCTHVNLETNETDFINASGEIVKDKADVILSTDGAFSAVRDAMIRYPRYNFSQTYENYGYKELEIVPAANGGFQMDVNSLHIWPRSSFLMIALPNPGGNFTCTLFMPFEGEVSLEKLNTKEAVLSFFETYFPDVLPMMPNLVDDFFNNSTGNLTTMRCYPWVKNNVALMGDSAHAIVPFYGQGMNCSFEDCVVLDQCIDEFHGDWTKILDAYQKSRKPNADAIARLALQNFIEMRDLVGSPEFLHKKHVEHDLVVLYPDKYKSQYERTTFSNDNYLDALNWGAKNDALLEYIISEKLEDKVNDAKFMEQLFAKML